MHNLTQQEHKMFTTYELALILSALEYTTTHGYVDCEDIEERSDMLAIIAKTSTMINIKTELENI